MRQAAQVCLAGPDNERAARGPGFQGSRRLTGRQVRQRAIRARAPSGPGAAVLWLYLLRHCGAPLQRRRHHRLGLGERGRQAVHAAHQLHSAHPPDMVVLVARQLHGPTIATQLDATTLAPPVWQAEVLDTGAILLRRDGGPP